jgi:uncharacterized protein
MFVQSSPPKLFSCYAAIPTALSSSPIVEELVTMNVGTGILSVSSHRVGAMLLLLVTITVGAPRQAEGAAVSRRTASREIRFTSGKVTLAGLIRLPASPPPHPAVVLLAGSLPTTKEDERLATVAAAFVAQGFTVLTTDSRGTGASEGEFASASLELLSDDAAAAAKVLRQRPDVLAKAVGFWGTSQGASWVGPLAAERASSAFLIAVSGPLASPETYLNRFLAGRLRSAHGLDEATIERVTTARRDVWDYYATGQGYEEAKTAVEALRREPWYTSSGLPPTVTAPSELGGLPAPTRTFLLQKDFDPLAVIARLRCPLLAVYGAQDTLLPVADHAARLSTLGSRPDARITIAVLAGLDHDLRPVPDAATDPIAKDLFAMMARWTAAQVTAIGGRATKRLDASSPARRGVLSTHPRSHRPAAAAGLLTN